MNKQRYMSQMEEKIKFKQILSLKQTLMKQRQVIYLIEFKIMVIKLLTELRRNNI